jgi:predicted outer membrane repeat protein
MNRAERRNQPRPKSSARKTGLTFITVAGVVSGAVGLASPAHAAVYTSTDCSDLISDLTALEADDGGTLTANFSGDCDLAGGYIFEGSTTIIGPADGSLNLRFTSSVGSGFTFSEGGVNGHSVSNLNFTKTTDASLNFLIQLQPGGFSLEVSNSTFSDATMIAAIYVEGNLTVSDSTFENLTSTSSGAAILVPESSSVTSIENSTFTNNQATGQASGGAVYARGALTIIDSTFDSNVAGDQGGAVYAQEVTMISNSTFVGNSAMTGAAVVFGEGGVISNSTFWNNGDADTSSIGGNSGFFGNILANDSSDTVKLFEPQSTIFDGGANLYTDTSFADTTIGVGSSELVTADQLNLSALYLNQTEPATPGTTETVSISTDSIAYDFYTADSLGINPTFDGNMSSVLAEYDQRGAARPFGAGYDVGAFESGDTPDPDPEPSVEPEETNTEALADTGLPTVAGYLGLVGLGAAAILGGSAGLLRRRKKA